jgi:hypothetical protein
MIGGDEKQMIGDKVFVIEMYCRNRESGTRFEGRIGNEMFIRRVISQIEAQVVMEKFTAAVEGMGKTIQGGGQVEG